ncbi:MAG: GlsB/YeaQ/YmgE family stress response membrane protein [Ignavibacteriae bacterium]|nr:GlsB/YeaQ/YmgE family stress response membrane protein [Ignavibacteriota bacterium]
MGFISWIIVGGLAGWLSTKIVTPKNKKGCLGNIILGIVGAFVGGFLVSQLGGTGVTDFNIHGILVATLGAVIILWISKLISN